LEASSGFIVVYLSFRIPFYSYSGYLCTGCYYWNILLLYLFNFSLNLLTLFAMLLAIGIVVDDAIVVVEAVHAKLDQDILQREKHP